jgi:hypothetical protein
MTKDEALKLALKALETELSIDWTNNDEFNASAEKMHEAITAIKEALAQPQRIWQGLTDEEIDHIYTGIRAVHHEIDSYVFARAIEAKLKEKNTRQDGDCKHCVNGCPACDARRQSNVLP